MTVVLLDQQHAGEPDQRRVVGEDADDVGATADLAVDAFERVRRAQLGPVLGGEAIEGEQVLLGLGEQLGDLRRGRRELLDHRRDALARLVVAVGVEHLPQRGRHERALARPAVLVHVADEVHRTGGAGKNAVTSRH
jgi:hypothetical protein